MRWDPRFTERHPGLRALAPAEARFALHADWPEPHEHPTLDVDGASVRFVPQGPKSRRRARTQRAREDLYDVRIDAAGEVPTRLRNAHDYFNALVWAMFPRAKRRLAARQARAHRERVGDRFETLPSTRTEEQDALALLDEGSALVLVEPSREASVAELLRAGEHNPLRALVAQGDARVLLFGHAVYEHLAAGLGQVRALPVLLGVAGPWPPSCAQADEALAEALTVDARWAQRPSLLALTVDEALFPQV